jgi:hypothetical protein
MADDGFIEATEEHRVVLVSPGEMPCAHVLFRPNFLTRDGQVGNRCDVDMPERRNDALVGCHGSLGALAGSIDKRERRLAAHGTVEMAYPSSYT